MQKTQLGVVRHVALDVGQASGLHFVFLLERLIRGPRDPTVPWYAMYVQKTIK
jgi:hypothetical protein